MNRIYKYNPDTTYKPNQGRYLQLISAKDLYIQNIPVNMIVFKLNFQTFLRIIHLVQLELRIKDLLILMIINLFYGKRN